MFKIKKLYRREEIIVSFYIADSELEKFIEEDISPIDLTSYVLGIGDDKTILSFRSRDKIVVCGTEEVESIFRKLGLETELIIPSGVEVDEGVTFIKGVGKAKDVHKAWRTSSKILESFCGVATRTRQFVKAAKSVNSNVNVAATRKNMPGTKKMALKAIMAGGAYPHRIGLSETILIFDEHIKLIGGLDKLIEKIPKIILSSLEKKVAVEAHNHEDGIRLVKAGIDIIQLDKFKVEDLKKFVLEAKEINPKLVIVAAGNIRQDNAKEYGATGVDILATSALYFGKPADIKADIEKI
jgi:molybdenum transport protein